MDIIKRSPVIKITKIPFINTIVIKQVDRKFFITTRDSIVIDVSGLSMILRFLVLNNMIDCEMLEKIVDEYKSKTN